MPLKSSIFMKLDNLIKYHRKAAGLPQAELASLAGVSRKVVQTLEAGNTKVSWDNVLAVLQTLNINLEPVGPLVDRWRKLENPGPESEPEATNSKRHG
jgi:DNA-binding XRE family transcriptional regulator